MVWGPRVHLALLRRAEGKSGEPRPGAWDPAETRTRHWWYWADGRELARAIGSDSRLALSEQPVATLYQLRRKCLAWYLLLPGRPPVVQQGADDF